MTELCLQQKYGHKGICFGCGPNNQRGLRIQSFPKGDELVAEWKAEKHHEAFEGTVSGGIVGTLLDCHSNWTAAYFLMKASGADWVPSTVTADYHVKLRRPAPSAAVLTIRGRAVELGSDRATVEATLEANGQVCATCRGTFVVVKPGHPAYHRW